MSEPIDEPVPKLPRGRGLKFSGPELFRIALTLTTLVGVIVLTKPCASAVSGFVTGFDGSASEQKMPAPGNVDEPTHMEALHPGMTDEEIKAAIERSKARGARGGGSAVTGSSRTGGSNAAGGHDAAAGSAAPTGASDGSAPPQR